MSSEAVKRALIIAFFFPPDASSGTFRTLKFVKYLEQFGWQCVVLSVDPKHEPLEPKDDTLLKQVPASAVVMRTFALSPLKAPTRLLRGALKWLSFPDRYVGWFPFALWRGWRAMRKYRPDVIYTTAPPVTGSLVGLALSALTGTPLVSDFRDPWVGDHYIRNYSPTRLHMARWLERKTFTRSAKVINISEGLSAKARERTPELPAERFAVITNGFDPDDFVALPARVPNGEFRVTYAGCFYPPAREPRCFLQAMAWLSKHHAEEFRSISAHFVGEPGWRDANAAWLEELKLGEHVRFLPFQPHHEAVRLLGESDALLLLGSIRKTDTGTLTGKLMEYLAAARPILALAHEGELAQVVRESGVGVVANPESAEDIGEKLLRMHRDIRAGRFARTTNADVVARFDRRELTRRLAGILDTAVSVRD